MAPMRISTLYLDTSVIGGYHDALWQQDTRELWQQHKNGLWYFISSGLVAQEVADAPPEVQQTFEDTFDRSKDLLPMISEIEENPKEIIYATTNDQDL
jgi:hypothetical protein